MSGYVAGNILNGKMTPLYWRELQQADLTKVTLVDVRTKDEYELGHISGAVNVPLDEMRSRMKEIPSDKPVFLYCGVGLRGYLASNILKENGYKDVRNLIGGIKTYNAAVTPVCQPEETCAVACSCETAEGSSDCKKVHVVDACGIQCPGPILRLKKGMEELKAGEQMEIHATDAGFPRDAEAWCRTTGNRFLPQSRKEESIR